MASVGSPIRARHRVPLLMLGKAFAAMAGVVAIGLAASGCRGLSGLMGSPGRPAGPVSVSVRIPAAALAGALSARGAARSAMLRPAGMDAGSAPQASPLSSVRVTLLKDAHVLTRQQPVPEAGAGDAEITFSFEKVYEGTWDVVGEAMDQAGDTVYAGSTRLTLAEGAQGHVDLRLVARPAILQVTVDLSGYDREAYVTEMSVSLTSATTSTLTEPRPGRALTWTMERERTPGTCDLRVRLIQGDGQVEFSSEWATDVLLLPGKRTQLTFRPAAGSTIIAGEVDLVPAPPAVTRCEAVASDEVLYVEWTPPADGDIGRYRVYVRLPDEATMDLAHEVFSPVSAVGLHETGIPWKTGGSVKVAVTAVDQAGQESAIVWRECTVPAPEPAAATAPPA